MLRVKICGITSLEDASLAVRLGVHALGFILAPSPRQVSPEAVRDIVRGIPPLVQTVGVFVNEAPSRVQEIMGFCGLDLAQLHGDESPADCEALMPRAIKALRLRDESSLAAAATYRGKVRAVLLDSYVKGRRGGTGTTLDWDLAARGLELGIPVMAGTSRKSFVGRASGTEGSAADRMAGSLAAMVISIMKGAHIVRVHDVKESVEAARVCDAVISG